MIDYFRIYKRTGPSVPHSLVLNGRHNMAWDYIRVPAAGVHTITLTAQLLDQFDRPCPLRPGERIRWRFSSDIGGGTPLFPYPVQGGREPDWWSGVTAHYMDGITLHPDTGELSVPAGTGKDKDLFLTACLTGADTAGESPDGVRQVRATKHVKLSDRPSSPYRIEFTNPPASIRPGDTWELSVKVYDQYLQEIPDAPVNLYIAENISGRAAVSVPDGVTLQGPKLTVSPHVPAQTFLIITAETVNGIYQSLPLRIG
jgi:hypothetical protein